MNEKQEIRLEIIKKWQEEFNEEWDIDEVLLAIKNLENWDRWQNIAVFAPRQDEINFVEKLEKQTNKKLFFPLIKNDEMTFLPSNYSDLKLGKYGILEPQNFPGKIYTEKIDAIFVPALAVDRSGNRLGRGKGFYDKFLNKKIMKNIFSICVMPDFAILPEIPTEKHDQRISKIIAVKKVN
jgi:5-formyltetrahydrofolate cyclo-ligase